MKPKTVFANITNKCNISCRHCYFKSGNALEDELSTREWFGIINELGENGITDFRINGGEPTVIADWLDILKYSRDRGLNTGIVSNSKNYNEIILARIPEGIQLSFSLDGARSETHDYLRNSEGLFDHLIGTIKESKKRGFDVRTFTVISRINSVEVEGIVDLLDKLGVNSAAFFYLSPFGRARENYETLALEPREFGKVLERIKNRVKDLDSQTRFFVEPTFEGMFTTEPLCSLYEKNICSIDPEGDVYFCSTMIDWTKQYSLGNLREKSFSEIWDSSPSWEKIKNESKNCKGCTAHYLRNGEQGMGEENVKPKCFMHWEEIK